MNASAWLRGTSNSMLCTSKFLMTAPLQRGSTTVERLSLRSTSEPLDFAGGARVTECRPDGTRPLGGSADTIFGRRVWNPRGPERTRSNPALPHGRLPPQPSSWAPVEGQQNRALVGVRVVVGDQIEPDSAVGTGHGRESFEVVDSHRRGDVHPGNHGGAAKHLQRNPIAPLLVVGPRQVDRAHCRGAFDGD